MMVLPWPSSSTIWEPDCVRQVNWVSMGCLKHSSLGLEGEGAGEQVGVLLEFGRIRGWNVADRGEVLLDAGLLEAGFGKVLRGADEGSGLALDGGAKRGKVASGFGRHEEDGLLGFGGDLDEDAFLADLGVPGFDADEPVVRRRVGVAAEEDADQQIFDRLRGGQVGVQPDAVAGLQVGDRGDGQRLAGAVGGEAGDADVDAGADEVEAGVGEGGCRNGEEQQGEQVSQPSGAQSHMLSLDG